MKTVPIVVALPGSILAIVSLYGLARHSSFAKISTIALASILVLALIALGIRFLVRSGMVWRPLYFLARRRLKPIGPPIVDERAAYYSEWMKVHCPMLSMTGKEFAQRTLLPRWEAEFLISNPDFIPRLDVHELVRKALMIGEHWPQGGYGEQCTRERLLWYAEREQFAWTLEEIEKATAEDRESALGALERDLREGLETAFK